MPSSSFPQPKISRGALARATAVFALLAGALASFAQENTLPAAAPPPVRMAYSLSVFIGLNPADARNAIAIVTKNFAQESTLGMDVAHLIYENTEELAQLIDGGTVYAVNMNTPEYWLLREKARLDRFLVNIRNGTETETYLLLTRADGPLKSLAELQGKRLNVLTNSAMVLATVWLDVELAKATLPTTTKFFAPPSDFFKPAKVVLPVFFGQADACLTTRSSYALMVELNPQVGKQLRIIASSPPLIPLLYGFRDNCEPKAKEGAIHTMVTMHNTISGRQTLALSQIEEIAERPATTFDASLALLDEHARLCPEASARLLATLRGKIRVSAP